MKNKYYKRLLELEGEGKVSYDIGYRGGNYSVSGSKALELVGWLTENSHLLPRNFGAYTNYLGGGLRGAICTSDYDKTIPQKYAKELAKLTEACKQRYCEIENGSGLNDEIDSDGETNWDAVGSNRCRVAGIKSAY